MDKKPFEKWWCWLLASAMFLAFVQVLFTIEAPNKWLEAKWDAGDLISFAGTIVLGFIAISQTQYANKMNQKLLEMQYNEYRPLLEITGMVGITKHQLTPAEEDFDKSIALHVMRDAENKVYLGYSKAFKVDEMDCSKETFCRSYEIHCKYNGKAAIESLSVKSLAFEGIEYCKDFNIGGDNLMSLTPGEEQSFFFFLVSNSNFQETSSQAYQLISTRKMVLTVILTTFDGKRYNEKISIVKHLVREPEQRFNLPNVELPVSVSYELRDM